MPIMVICIMQLIHAFTVNSLEERVATEGKNFTVKTVFKYHDVTQLKIAWYQDDHVTSICYLKEDRGCSEYYTDKTHTILSAVVGQAHTYETFLTIINVTKSDSALWSLQYLGPARYEHPQNLYSFKLAIMDRAQANDTNIPTQKLTTPTLATNTLATNTQATDSLATDTYSLANDTSAQTHKKKQAKYTDTSYEKNYNVQINLIILITTMVVSMVAIVSLLIYICIYKKKEYVRFKDRNEPLFPLGGGHVPPPSHVMLMTG